MLMAKQSELSAFERGMIVGSWEMGYSISEIIETFDKPLYDVTGNTL